MTELKDVIVPIVVALASALLAAFFTIKLKFASSEKEAMESIWGFGKNLVFLILVGWLFYDLVRRGISAEPVTRAEILLMIIDAFTLILIMFFFVARKFIQIIQSSFELHGRHLDATHKTISIINANQQSVNDLPKAGDITGDSA